MPKQYKTSSELLNDILKIHVPDEYLKYFELESVNNKSNCWELVLVEKSDLVPEKLVDKAAVLDGFCNPISILTHAFSLKQIYLIIKRRRWKPAGSDEHVSNSYDLHPKGAKITNEFAVFFKTGH